MFHQGQLLAIGGVLLAFGCESSVPEEAVSTNSQWAEFVSRKDYGRRIAVIIAVDDYPNAVGNELTSFRFAVKDARALERRLVNEFGFENALFLKNEAATPSAIRTIFEKVLKGEESWKDWLGGRKLRLAQNDAVLVFFSGHGVVDWETPKTPGYLVVSPESIGPDSGSGVDQSRVPVEWVRDQLEDLPCNHIGVILDCCYAGSLFLNDVSDKGMTSAQGASSGIAYYLGERAFWGMSAARATPAIEATNGYSIFMDALLKELDERTDSQRKRNVFTFNELAVGVQRRLDGRVDTDQVPKSGRLGDGDGEFLFIPTVRRATPSEAAQSLKYSVALKRISRLADEDPAFASQLLDDDRICPEELRDFMWKLLRRSCSTPHESFRAHERPLHYVRFTPQGSLVTGSLFGSVKLWVREGSGWTQGGRFRMPTGDGVELSSASGSLNGEFVVGGFFGVGRSDGQVAVWRTADCSVEGLFDVPVAPVIVAVNNDGSTVGVGSYDKTVRLWDVAAGRELRRFTESEGLPGEIAFSPDGKQVAASSYEYERRVRVWDTKTGNLLGKLEGHGDGRLGSVTYSPSGEALACADRSEVMIWDANSLTKVRSLSAQCAKPHGIAFSPDGAMLGVAGGDDEHGVKIWDSRKWQLSASLPGSAFSVGFAPDGKTLGAGCIDGTVRVWHRDDWSSLKSTDLFQMPGAATSIAVAPRGDWIAAASLDRTVRMHNVKTKQTESRPETSGIVSALAFGNDGDVLAMATRNGIARILDCRSLKEVFALERHHASIIGIGFLDDGEIWTASDDGSIRVWDEATGTSNGQLFTSDTSIVAAVVSDGGRCAVALESGEIVVIEVDGEVITVAEGEVPVWSLTFSPDGRWLLGCGEDAFVKRWTISAPEAATVLEGHVGTVWSGEFLDDGGTIVTTGEDGTIRFWDAMTGHERGRFAEHTESVSCLGISRDGLTIATSGADHSVRLWSAK